LGFTAKVGLEEGLRKFVKWRNQVISSHHYAEYAERNT
jgi:hypothetical protein